MLAQKRLEYEKVGVLTRVGGPAIIRRVCLRRQTFAFDPSTGALLPAPRVFISWAPPRPCSL